MLSPVDLYYSPPPKSRLKLKPKSKLQPSSKVINGEAPVRLGLGSSSSSSSSRNTDADVDQKIGKKRSRSTRACDVCRTNHRKCPGPGSNPNSTSCERCIKQHKECTWNQFLSRQASASISPRSRRINIVVKQQDQQGGCLGKSFPKAQLAPVREAEGAKEPMISPASCSSSRGSSDASQLDTPPPPPLAGVVKSSQDAIMFKSMHCEGSNFSYTKPQLSFNSSYHQQHFQTHQFHGVDPQQQQNPVLLEEEKKQEKQVQPEYHADLLHMANRHNLLLFALPLQVWEERLLPKDSSLLHCVSPSYIHPQPNQEEMLGIVQALVSPEKVPKKAAVEAVTGSEMVVKITTRERRKDLDYSSDEEPFPPIASDTSDDDNEISTPLAPVNTTAPVEKIMDTQENSTDPFEPEPEFFISPLPQPHLTSPYRHQADTTTRFDPFLFSPCHCFGTPQSQILASDDIEKLPQSDQGRWDTKWDEDMPDILDEASQDEPLEDWFRLNLIADDDDECAELCST